MDQIVLFIKRESAQNQKELSSLIMFASLELSKKLSELGCVSESGYRYFTTYRGEHILEQFYHEFPDYEKVKHGPMAGS